MKTRKQKPCVLCAALRASLLPLFALKHCLFAFRFQVKTVTGAKFVLAMGGRPNYPEIPGWELGTLFFFNKLGCFRACECVTVNLTIAPFFLCSGVLQVFRPTTFSGATLHRAKRKSANEA